MGKRKISHYSSAKPNKNSKPKLTYKNKFNKVMNYQDGQFFEVEAVRTRKGDDDDPSYWIKWKGWPEDTNTWEPLKNLKNVRHLVVEYEKSNNPNKNLDFLNAHFSETGSISIESDPDGDIKSDIPMRILNIEQDPEDKELIVKIDWVVRQDTGFKPISTWVSTNKFKKEYSLMLIEFYEKLLRFCK